MSANPHQPTDTATQAGLSSPHPAATHQGAAAFEIERIDGAGCAAKLLVNPSKGTWLRKVGGGYVIQEASGYRFTISERWVTEHHAGAARALAAVESIELGNNGYADIGTDESVALAVEAAGFKVIRTKDLHGRAVFRGFTARSQAALCVSPHGFSTYRALPRQLPAPDFEASILARQERFFEGV